MIGRCGLIAVIGMLALAGCRDTSAEAPKKGAAVADALIDLPPAPLAITEPDPPAPPKPTPVVTVRAQPTPRNPLDLPPSEEEGAVEPFPREVTAFMVDRDGCDHFRGEEPYDAERRAYLEASIRELCIGTDARLARLRQRYASDPDVMAALAQYEDRIEAVARP